MASKYKTNNNYQYHNSNFAFLLARNDRSRRDDVREKRKRAQKRQLKKDDHVELMQEKCKRLTTEETLVLAEKVKFYQMCRQTEREKEKLFQFQMTMDKKSTKACIVQQYLQSP